MPNPETTDPRKVALDELVAQAQELKLDYQPTAGANQTTPGLEMARALRGSLENGCGITVKDFDILIAEMEGRK